jgi:hypothetical protein
MINIRALFKANCGPGAVYLGSELKQRGEWNTVLVNFEIIPEGRKFTLDGVIHGPTDEDMEKAVMRIAGIARDIREHIKPEEVKA